MVLLSHVNIAFGFVSIEVNGATPKNPASGLIAYNLPSFPNFIQAISSPTTSTFHPGRVGINIAKLVLPQALGKAAATYFFLPSGLVIPIINICSAIQPCSRAIAEAIRNAKHFFPNNAFPPYPDPYDQISLVSGK